MNVIERIHRASEAKIDAWGSVIVVSLSVGGVFLMRTFLAWAQ
jgi:hypothetical protein